MYSGIFKLQEVILPLKKKAHESLFIIIKKSKINVLNMFPSHSNSSEHEILKIFRPLEPLFPPWELF